MSEKAQRSRQIGQDTTYLGERLQLTPIYNGIITQDYPIPQVNVLEAPLEVYLISTTSTSPARRITVTPTSSS